MWPVVIASIFVVVMLVGPIMMLQPNKQQRRLARLRSLASKQDIRVRLGQNPTNGEPRQLALYSRPLGELPAGVKIRTWCLGRQSLEHELNFLAEWDWVAGSRASEYVQHELKPWVQNLPAPIRAIEVTESSVIFYWTETCWERQPRWEDSMQHCLETVDVELRWLADLVTSERETSLGN